MKREAIFKYDNKNNWDGQRVAVSTALKIDLDNARGDMRVIIEPYKPRGEKALRGYWMLLGVIEKWMREQGNHFNKEELSDYFKFQVSHSKCLNDTWVVRSIANNSDCTYDDMKKLLDYIIQFGAENNIKGCELTSEQEREFINYYS